MSKSLLTLGIPDLPERAFLKSPSGRILPQGGKGSAPATPDYAALAREQAAGNLEMAKYTTQVNRANQYTPWGNLEWANDRAFDQEGFDKALAAYEQGLANQQTTTTFTPAGLEGYEYRDPTTGQWRDYSQTRNADGTPHTPLEAPNRDDFYSGGDNWRQDITLSPEMQALFDQEARLQQNMFGSQNAALDRVNQTMGQGFDMSQLGPGGQPLDIGGLPSMGSSLDMSQVPGYGNVLNMSQIPGYGQVLDQGSLPGYGSVLDMTSLPSQGTALNRSSLPAMGEVFGGSRGFLDVYDPELQTNNATELIMRRLAPELERQSESLRTRLANQGLGMDSQAYSNAMGRFGQHMNDATTNAALQGIGLGMQQQGLQFNQGLQNRQLTAAEQAQRFGQQSTNHQLGLAGQAQEFGQQQGLYQNALAAQGQQFGQSTTNQQLAAALQAQQYAQQSQNQQIGLGAQAQQYGQQSQNQQIGIGAQAQQFQQQQAMRQLEASLQNQQYAQAEQQRQRQMSEQAYLRNLPMNELNALRTGNQVGMPQFPGYTQQAAVGGPDLVGAASQQYQADLARYNAQQAGGGNFLGGLVGLGGSLLTGAGAAGGFGKLFTLGG